MPRVEFGSDGIRGIVGQEPIVPSAVVCIGQALGRYIRERSEGEDPFVVIGRDTRPSGASLLSNLTDGLTGQGVDVIDLGVMTTPGIAFLAQRLEADLGLIVSASHSPYEYNGIKVVNRSGLRLQREEEIAIEALIQECLAGPPPAREPGQQTDGRNLVDICIADCVECCGSEALVGLTVVLDCAAGAASRVAPEAFLRLGAQVAEVNCPTADTRINDRCGSEHAREHPEDLVREMAQHGAGYGFAFDGDGDRLVVVDADSRVYEGEDLLFVLARYYQSAGLLRGDTIVTTDLANRGLEDALRQFGIELFYANKGDKNLEAAMWWGDFFLGGEPGGNILINDGRHTAADAVYAALVLGQVLVDSPDRSLAEMAAPLRRRPQATVTIRLPRMPTLAEWAVLRSEIERQQVMLGDDSRILLWPASTEPGRFRVMVEGDYGHTCEQVSTLAEELSQYVQRTVGRQQRSNT